MSKKGRVTGIGGIFFKSAQSDELKTWYSEHLGIPAEQYGATFEWLLPENPRQKGHTVWNPFDGKTKYFEPSKHDYMINYRVENLVDLLKELQDHGVQIVGELQEYDYGKFAHILDPEGRKIELWEPVNEEMEKMEEGKISAS